MPLTHTHTHTAGPLSGTTRVSRYQKGKTNLDFTEARDSEWQWHQLGCMQVCTRQITMPAPTTQFFTGRVPFLPPTQSTHTHTQTHTHTHTRTPRLMALCLGLPRWASTREVKPIWILLKQRDSEWHWRQLNHMQLCTSLQTDNHASTPPLSLLQAGCPSCRPTNSINALPPTQSTKGKSTQGKCH